jgi:hypothetical protein
MNTRAVAERVVFSLSHFVNVTVDYQPDMVHLPGNNGTKTFEYFSKGTLRFLNKADCEDLAWYMTSLLEAIQDVDFKKIPAADLPLLRRAHRALQEYIPASAVVQGTAPEYRKCKYNLCLKPCYFVDAEHDRQEQSLMHVFHVTSFLFPKKQFLECVERGRQDLEFGQQWDPVEPVGEDSLPRLIAEPTQCVGADVSFQVLDAEEEALIPDEEPLCLPVGMESPNATLLYGALIEVITNWFIRKRIGPQCFTFVAAISKNGEKNRYIAPEDEHWGQPGADFSFIASKDISPLLNYKSPEALTRFMADIPVPWLTKLPKDFEKRLAVLKKLCGDTGLFEPRFRWRLSGKKGRRGVQHPMRDGLWLIPPPP